MPSPFPGMDPYLEDPEIFPGLHNSLITCLQAELQPKLVEPYYAAASERRWTEVSEPCASPNVSVAVRAQRAVSSARQSGVAIADPTATQPILIRVPHYERWESHLGIYTGYHRERLVASLEILSPSS